MEKDVNISEEQLNSMSEFVKEVQSNAKNLHTQISADGGPPFVPAAISLTLSGGPAGANIQGWITYMDGKKIYFYGHGSMEYGLPVAMTCALPAVLVLPYEQLRNAANGTWEANGSTGSGALIIQADNNWISPIPFPVLGSAFLGWKILGTLSFQAH